MGNDDVTVAILREIRDETKANGARLDRTNERLDRVVQEQIRHATAIVGLEGRMGGLEGRMGEMAEGQRALVAAVTRLDDGQRAIVGELVKLNARTDNVLTGPLGASVKDTAARVDALEERMAAVERRHA